MDRLIPPVLAQTRNSFLYGTSREDVIQTGAGNDYLRGYAGDDVLAGGTGADRFVFERTLAANGVDTIADYQWSEGDVLDLSLVGFARGVFNRYPLSDIIRLDYTGGGEVRLQLDLNGGGDGFQTWAVLQNVWGGSSIRIQVGNLWLTAEVPSVAPQIQAFQVGGAEMLSVTTDENATAGLYLPGTGSPGQPAGSPPVAATPGTLVGTSTALTALAPGVIHVSAQQTLTTAVLRVSSGLYVTAPVLDTLVYLGTQGADGVTGTAAADIVFAFAGNDVINAGDGADTVQGGAGDDTLNGQAGADLLSGGAGADWLDGGGDNDVLVFASAAELGEDASVIGGQGSDTIRLDTLDAAVELTDADFSRVAGVEVLALNGTGAHGVTLGSSADAAFADGIRVTIQESAIGLSLTATAGMTRAIHATGTASADDLFGGAGNDTLLGGDGDDGLRGGGGADSLDAGAGDDFLEFASAQELGGDMAVIGGDGSDIILLLTEGDDVTLLDSDLDGVSGMEGLFLAGTGDLAIQLGVNASTAFANSLFLVANVDAKSLRLDGSDAGWTQGIFSGGTIHADTLIGGVGNDLLAGYEGDDILAGGAGMDGLFGDAGNDTIHGDGANDTLTGGAGADSLVGGDGDDVFVFDESVDMALSLVYADRNTNQALDDGDWLVFGAGAAGVDVIADLSLAGTDRLLFTGGVSGVGSFDVNADGYGIGAGEWGSVRGAFDAALGRFTVDQQGADMLLGVNTFGSSSTALVVLSGVVNIDITSFVNTSLP